MNNYQHIIDLLRKHKDAVKQLQTIESCIESLPAGTAKDEVIEQMINDYFEVWAEE